MRKRVLNQVSDSCSDLSRCLRSLSQLASAIFGVLLTFTLVIALCYVIYILVGILKGTRPHVDILDFGGLSTQQADADAKEAVTEPHSKLVEEDGAERQSPPESRRTAEDLEVRKGTLLIDWSFAFLRSKGSFVGCGVTMGELPQ